MKEGVKAVVCSEVLYLTGKMQAMHKNIHKTDIQIKILEWLGYVQRMDQSKVSKITLIIDQIIKYRKRKTQIKMN